MAAPCGMRGVFVSSSACVWVRLFLAALFLVCACGIRYNEFMTDDVLEKSAEQFDKDDEAYVFMQYGYGKRPQSILDASPDLFTAMYSIRQAEVREHGRMRRRALVLMADSKPLSGEEQKLFARLGMEARHVPLISPDPSSYCASHLPGAKKRLLDSFTKINIWNLTDFRRILYLDTDLVVRHDLETLFMQVNGADAVTAPTACKQCPPVDQARLVQLSSATETVKSMLHSMNTGVVAIKPSEEVFGLFQSAVKDLNLFCPDGSQALENSMLNSLARKRLIFKLGCISVAYNCKMDQGNCWCSGGTSHKETAIYHWSGESKPW